MLWLLGLDASLQGFDVSWHFLLCLAADDERDEQRAGSAAQAEIGGFLAPVPWRRRQIAKVPAAAGRWRMASVKIDPVYFDVYLDSVSAAHSRIVGRIQAVWADAV